MMKIVNAICNMKMAILKFNCSGSILDKKEKMTHTYSIPY